MGGWANAGGVMYDPNENLTTGGGVASPNTAPISYDQILASLQSKYDTMPTQAGGYLRQVQIPNIAYPTMPQYSTGRERSLQQKYASPMLSSLRTKLRGVIQGNQGKPLPAASYANREALAGYGEGTARIMSGALSPAHSAQMTELNQESQNVLGNYQAQVANAQAKYNQEYAIALQKENERKSLEGMIREIQLKNIAQRRSNYNIPSLADASKALNDRLSSLTVAPANKDYATTIWGEDNTPETTTEGDALYKEFKGTWGANTGSTSPKTDPNDIYNYEANLPYPEVPVATSTQIPSAISHTPYSPYSSYLDIQRLKGKSTLGGA